MIEKVSLRVSDNNDPDPIDITLNIMLAALAACIFACGLYNMKHLK